ncbi:hypothetical protein F4680DRAFT_443943 [Xylaria scruposa]|nr:hypothetical protein F4680DRAFT_443943 [Xylaria scruposa]
MTSSSTPVLSETRAPSIYGTIITEIVLSITFVALRLQARRLSFGYLRLDLSDWLTISGLLFALVHFLTIIVGTTFGLGRHVEAVTDVRGFYILSLVSNAFNPLALGSLKLSILALYRSIFPSTRFHYVITALASLVVAWAVVSLVLGIVYCLPVERLWDNMIPHAHCLPVSAVQFIVVSVHIGIEILILLLPIPSVLKLQASAEKKRLIILTFVVGGVDCIVGIARPPVWVYELSESVDVTCKFKSFTAQKLIADLRFTGKLVAPVLLGATELTVGFLAVSFPIYRPLFKKSAHTDDRNHQLVEVGGSPRACHDRFSRPRNEVTISAVQDFSTRHVGIMATEEIELMRRSNIGGGWMKVPDEEELKKP